MKMRVSWVVLGLVAGFSSLSYADIASTTYVDDVANTKITAPAGGENGQVLTKTSDGTAWADETGIQNLADQATAPVSLAIGFAADEIPAEVVALAAGLGLTAEELPTMANGGGAIAFGVAAHAVGDGAVALGSGNLADHAVAAGVLNEAGAGSAVFGSYNYASGDNIAVGLYNDVSGLHAVSIGGDNTVAGESSIAIGSGADTTATANNAIQLGTGTNSNAGTLQFRNYPLVGSTGLIPSGRIADNDATAESGLVLKKTDDGMEWAEDLNPTVNDAILTIAHNGTTDTWTSNSGTAKTITITDNDTTYNTGSADVAGITKLYTGTGTADDGTMTQAAINTALAGKINQASNDSTASVGQVLTKTSDGTAWADETGIQNLADLTTSPLAVAIGFTADEVPAELIAQVAEFGFTAEDVPTVATGVSSTALGLGAQAIGETSLAVGPVTKATEQYGVAVGVGSSAGVGVAVGSAAIADGFLATSLGVQSQANGDNSVAIGVLSLANGDVSVAIGGDTQSNGDYSISLGAGSRANGDGSIAMGLGANATADGAIQLGTGTNDDANTLQFMDHKLVDSNGKIPSERIGGNDGVSGQVLTKTASGMEWADPDTGDAAVSKIRIGETGSNLANMWIE